MNEERRPYYFPPDLIQSDLRACRLGCGCAVYYKDHEQFDNCLLSEPHQCREEEPEKPKPKTRKTSTSKFRSKKRGAA